MLLKTKLLRVNINHRNVVITLDDALVYGDPAMAFRTASMPSTFGILVYSERRPKGMCGSKGMVLLFTLYYSSKPVLLEVNSLVIVKRYYL